MCGRTPVASTPASRSQPRAQFGIDSASGVRLYGRQYETGPPSVACSPAAISASMIGCGHGEPCRIWTGKSGPATPSSTARVTAGSCATIG